MLEFEWHVVGSRHYVRCLPVHLCTAIHSDGGLTVGRAERCFPASLEHAVFDGWLSVFWFLMLLRLNWVLQVISCIVSLPNTGARSGELRQHEQSGWRRQVKSAAWLHCCGDAHVEGH